MLSIVISLYHTYIFAVKVVIYHKLYYILNQYIGTENQNLPGFVVLTSGGKTPDAGKSVWGSGFLPSVYQGVQCRSVGDPVLNIRNPQGVTRSMRRAVAPLISAL